jgi:hypothetical protein
MPARVNARTEIDTLIDIETPSGPARASITAARSGTKKRGLVVLGHGAGGGIEAPDLIALTRTLAADGWMVARVEQPYRLRGQRAPEPAARLDAALIAVVTELRERYPGGRLVLGGRSSGARVACRCAGALAADAVVALAFPLHPPRRPDKSRLPELTGAGVPVLVLQGSRDPFGTKAQFPADELVVEIAGDHSLRSGAAEAAGTAQVWLARI